MKNKALLRMLTVDTDSFLCYEIKRNFMSE